MRCQSNPLPPAASRVDRLFDVASPHPCTVSPTLSLPPLPALTVSSVRPPRINALSVQPSPSRPFPR
eukprot:1063357-Pleurochrysis_carterae.AAC.1